METAPAFVTARVGQTAFRLETMATSHQRKRIEAHGLWERHLSHFFAWLIPGISPAVFFDVGANIGYYTVLASKFAQSGGRVVAFEPNPSVRAVLHRNIELNACPSVTVDGRIVGDGRSRLRMVEPADFDEGGYAVEAGESADEPSISIDRYRSETGVAPTVIKIDAEGRDFDVVHGALQTMKDVRPPVVFEYRPTMIAAISEIKPAPLFRGLQAIGYTPYLFRGHSVYAVEMVDFLILQRIYDLNVSEKNGGYWDVLLWPPQLPRLKIEFEMPL